MSAAVVAPPPVAKEKRRDPSSDDNNGEPIYGPGIVERLRARFGGGQVVALPRGAQAWATRSPSIDRLFGGDGIVISNNNGHGSSSKGTADWDGQVGAERGGGGGSTSLVRRNSRSTGDVRSTPYYGVDTTTFTTEDEEDGFSPPNSKPPPIALLRSRFEQDPSADHSRAHRGHADRGALSSARRERRDQTPGARVLRRNLLEAATAQSSDCSPRSYTSTASSNFSQDGSVRSNSQQLGNETPEFVRIGRRLRRAGGSVDSSVSMTGGDAQPRDDRLQQQQQQQQQPLQQQQQQQGHRNRKLSDVLATQVRDSTLTRLPPPAWSSHSVGTNPPDPSPHAVILRSTRALSPPEKQADKKDEEVVSDDADSDVSPPPDEPTPYALQTAHTPTSAQKRSTPSSGQQQPPRPAVPGVAPPSRRPHPPAKSSPDSDSGFSEVQRMLNKFHDARLARDSAPPIMSASSSASSSSSVTNIVLVEVRSPSSVLRDERRHATAAPGRSQDSAKPAGVKQPAQPQRQQSLPVVSSTIPTTGPLATVSPPSASSTPSTADQATRRSLSTQFLEQKKRQEGAADSGSVQSSDSPLPSSSLSTAVTNDLSSTHLPTARDFYRDVDDAEELSSPSSSSDDESPSTSESLSLMDNVNAPPQVAGDGNMVRHTLMSLVLEEDLPELLEAMADNDLTPEFEDIPKAASQSAVQGGILSSARRRRTQSDARVCWSHNEPSVYTYLDEGCSTADGRWSDGLHISFDDYQRMVTDDRDEHDDAMRQLALWKQTVAAQALAVSEPPPKSSTAGPPSDSDSSLGVTSRFTYGSFYPSSVTAAAASNEGAA